MSRTIANTPKADHLMGSMRSMGYTFESAVADVVDNSISAGATEIHINFPTTALETYVTILDNGIGMTEKELETNLGTIAKSGSLDFKTENKTDDMSIIGQFGVGFYSAFMVSDKVEIDSLSYQKDAAAAKWECDGSMEFELGDGDRQERGTTITLTITEDSKEFLEESTIRQILHKYCSFLPTEIYIENAGVVQW